jgi:membrane-associated phospholipid phosphatase
MLGVAAVFLSGYHLASWATLGRHVDLMTALDRAIPLWPWTAWFYVPLYAAGILTTGFLVRDGLSLRRAVVAVLAGQCVNTLGYALVPSTYPRAEVFADVTGGGTGMAILRFVHAIDPPNNTFPSAHVMVAFLCAALSWRTGSRLRWFPVLTGAGVALSVLTTKQHYVADSVAGLVVGALALRLADRLVRD